MLQEAHVDADTLRGLVRRVVETRLLLARGAIRLSDDQTAQAESTVRLVQCVLETVPAVIFNSQSAMNADSVPSDDSESVENSNQNDLAVLSQLCATMVPQHRNSAKEIVPSTAAHQAQHVPFDIWLIVSLISLLAAPSHAPLHQSITDVLRLLIEALISSAQSQYTRGYGVVRDLTRLVTDIASQICSVSMEVESTVVILASERDTYHACEDAAVFQMTLSTGKYRIFAHTNLSRLVRFLDEGVPSFLVLHAPILWAWNVRVCVAMLDVGEQAQLSSLKGRPRSANGGQRCEIEEEGEIFCVVTMESFEAWVQYMQLLDQVPASMVVSMTHSVFRMMQRVLMDTKTMIDSKNCNSICEKTAGTLDGLAVKVFETMMFLVPSQSSRSDASNGGKLELNFDYEYENDVGVRENAESALVAALCGGGIEQFILSKCFTASPKLKMVILKLLKRVLQSAVLQNLTLAQCLLDACEESLLSNDAVECLQILCASEEHSAMQKFGKREATLFANESARKKARLDAVGGSVNSNQTSVAPIVDFFASIALDILNMCCSSNPISKSARELETMHRKLQAICKILIPMQDGSQEFMKRILTPFGDACAKYSEIILSALQSGREPPLNCLFHLQVITCLTKFISDVDPGWKLAQFLPPLLTKICLSPWIPAFAAAFNSEDAISKQALDEYSRLFDSLHPLSAGFIRLSRKPNGKQVWLSGNESSSVANTMKECFEAVTKLHSTLHPLMEQYKHCRAMVLMTMLNEQLDSSTYDSEIGCEIVGLMAPAMPTLDENLWSWCSKNMRISKDTPEVILKFFASELGSVSCALSGSALACNRAVTCSAETDVRLNFLIALRKVLLHTRLEDLSLDKTTFLFECLNGLSSTTRSIRIATSELIPALFPYSDCGDLTSKEHLLLEANKIAFFPNMKKLFESAKIGAENEDTLETCILSVGLLGRSSCEKLLLPILYSLIAELGNANFSHRAVAVEQIKSIAKVYSKNVHDLMLPYLSDISIYLIDHLSVDGQLKEFSKLLGLSQKSFIERTIAFTLPHLIIQEKEDVIQELGIILSTNVGVLCVNQMSHVLKSIFMQNSEAKATSAISYVIKITRLEIQKEVSVKGLIVSCELELITNLVMELGDMNEGRKAKAKKALDVVFNGAAHNDVNTKALSDFLSKHFLGILSHFNHMLADQSPRVNDTERVKVISSLIELMKLVGNIVSLVPQILTTLQTALDIQSTRTVTLHAWEVFVHILGPQHIGPILNQVVAILLKGWAQCPENQLLHIIKIFESVILGNTEKLRTYFIQLCQFPRLREFDALNAAVDPYRSSDVPSKLKRLWKAVSHENSVVVESALAELRQLLTSEEGNLHAEVLSDSASDAVDETISVLLTTLKKYNGTRTDIQVACCECLGVLGATDPARIQVSIPSADVSLDAFEAKDASINFVCKFIERQLAPAFRSANNTQAQSHLAFAIQELLQFCGFTPEFHNIGLQRVDRSKVITATTETNARLIVLWQDFPRTVLEVIRPLLTTKYSMESLLQRQIASPIYSSATGFKDWLQLWVVDLMSKATGQYAKRILSVCMKAVESDNIGIALYLLPRLVLNVLTGGNSDYCKALLKEFNAVLNDAVGTSSAANSEKRQLSSQTIFHLVDHLTVWIRTRRRDAGKQRLMMARKSGRFANMEEDDDRDIPRQRVASFMSEIPTILMAEASYRCKSYARALLHFEQHIRHELKTKSQLEMQSTYEFFQQIYSHLEEPDGVEGISTKFLTPTIEQQIREHESGGRWTAAQTCYEVALQRNPDDLRLHMGLVNCLKNLGHLGTMLTHISGIVASHPSWSIELNSQAIEASWRLGSWDTLDKCLKKDHLPTFETDIGSLLMLAKRKEKDSFEMTLREARERLIAPLSAASMESYSRAYDNIVKLHMLHEVEFSCKQLWDELREDGDIDTVIKSWDSRLKITTPSLTVREPILNLRRILISDIGYQASVPNSRVECGKIWLQTAKALRAAGHFQPAYSAILHASELQTPTAMLQKAKWLSETNQLHKSISELNGILAKLEADNVAGSTKPSEAIKVALNTTMIPQAGLSKEALASNTLKAKTLLMMAKRMDEFSMGSSETIASHFTAAIAVKPEWEKGYFHMGRYYDKLLDNLLEAETRHMPTDRKTDRKVSAVHTQCNNLYHVCRNYSRALQYGTRYIYQTLPRLLTLWLDAGLDILKPELTESRPQHVFTKIMQCIRKMIDTIPAYQFLPAVPQLISRICHQNRQVHNLLEMLLSKVLSVYPQQTLWNLLSVSKSKYKVRATRCSAILQKVQSDPAFKEATVGKMEGIINEGIRLSDELLTLCNYHIAGKETMLNMAKDFRTLKRMAPLRMIVPTQKTLMVTLPSDSSPPTDSHRPFPSAPATIEGFYDDIEIMNSLQKPRKIQILGSDSKDYIFLLKPKDDLRKDARLMEFNGLINKLLKKDPEARKRNLRVRTYAVVPLNEECGIIEWVENTSGFRHIVMKSYRAKGIVQSPQEVKQLLDSDKMPPGESFTKLVLPRFPPVFHEWFLETFPEPTKWFASRLSYSGTVAVMSMVGYIVGLGDRHGENVLFDELTGDCVHVDLNCLFEKGLTFEKPEKVPFRLTQNMVDAFGVTGTEGVFRKACEMALRVLRTNRESLLAVLETFIHDPLCEWSKRVSGNSKQNLAALKEKEASGEKVNEEAVKHLRRIGMKLKGMANEKQALPLSIEGQVQELIAEATDPKNLGVMYVGE
ncbi:serine/threonine-protein kinase M1 [Chytriomyces hyalinus]|nr:serine/threonine-protein kinase M1 [Chytriomyces hyalinus]